MGMTNRLFKSFTVAAFSVLLISFSLPVFAEGGEGGHEPKKEKIFNAQEVIFGHILDGHEFHFFDIIKDDGTKKPVGIPLPVILYSPERGLSVFMSSKFHHGHEPYKNYRLIDQHYLDELTAEGHDVKKEGLNVGQIVAVSAENDKEIDKSVSVYDFSLTRT